MEFDEDLNQKPEAMPKPGPSGGKMGCSYALPKSFRGGQSKGLKTNDLAHGNAYDPSKYCTLCNILSDDSVPIRRLSQSHVSNNTFQGIVEVSPRSIRDQGFLNTRVMSWMTSRVKLSDDVDRASKMSRMMSQ